MDLNSKTNSARRQDLDASLGVSSDSNQAIGIQEVITCLGKASSEHGTGHKDTAQAIWSVARGLGMDFLSSLALVCDHLDWDAICYAQNEPQCLLQTRQATTLAAMERIALAAANKPSKRHVAKTASRQPKSLEILDKIT